MQSKGRVRVRGLVDKKIRGWYNHVSLHEKGEDKMIYNISLVVVACLSLWLVHYFANFCVDNDRRFKTTHPGYNLFRWRVTNIGLCRWTVKVFTVLCLVPGYWVFAILGRAREVAGLEIFTAMAILGTVSLMMILVGLIAGSWLAELLWRE
jgi:hypothetical protein